MPDYALGFILPVGISFYTFQSIGYTLDVYCRRIEAERDFIAYAQYVASFPSLWPGRSSGRRTCSRNSRSTR